MQHIACAGGKTGEIASGKRGERLFGIRVRNIAQGVESGKRLTGSQTAAGLNHNERNDRQRRKGLHDFAHAAYAREPACNQKRHIRADFRAKAH